MTRHTRLRFCATQRRFLAARIEHKRHTLTLALRNRFRESGATARQERTVDENAPVAEAAASNRYRRTRELPFLTSTSPAIAFFTIPRPMYHYLHSHKEAIHARSSRLARVQCALGARLGANLLL